MVIFLYPSKELSAVADPAVFVSLVYMSMLEWFVNRTDADGLTASRDG
jgi:hypothetical protein